MFQEACIRIGWIRIYVLTKFISQVISQFLRPLEIFYTNVFKVFGDIRSPWNLPLASIPLSFSSIKTLTSPYQVIEMHF